MPSGWFILHNIRIIESQNNRMVWVGMDLKYHLVPNPLPWAGTYTTRPGCSKADFVKKWLVNDFFLNSDLKIKKIYIFKIFKKLMISF